MRPPRRFSVRVVGVTFAPGYPETIGRIEASWVSRELRGEAPAPLPADLVRDPGNEHDPNAIQVVVAGEPIGHVAAAMAERLAPLLDAGEIWACEVTDVHTDPNRPATPGVTIRIHQEAA